ncbi:MAG TPA: NAD(P)H-hydrate dehydratase [Gemmatimonadales bacterium]|jgi:NAD(P)H-hydrate epimerase
MSVIPVLDANQAAAWDRAAQEISHIPSRVLMESAGRAVAALLTREFGHAVDRGVIVVCGRGNNGGDGWVAARALAAFGIGVTAIPLSGDPSADNTANRGLAMTEGVRVVSPTAEWPAAGVVIDAILGTGATGAPKGDVAAAIEKMQRLDLPIVAIDGPSGLDLTSGTVHAPCVRATLTVTFGGYRRGHLLQRTVCGKIQVAEIGFPTADPYWPGVVTDDWLGSVLSPLSAEMHKGDRGKVLVVGGGDGMAGAAIFSAKAALRSGSGLARIAASAASVTACQANNPDIVCLTSELAETIEEPLAEALEWAEAVVLGPGLGRGTARARFARAVLGALKTPVLLDADGLMAFRGAADELKGLLSGKRALLTPHKGEFAALFPDLSEQTRRDPFGAAQAAAERIGQAVLLKGVPTVIAAPSLPLLVSATGNPGLATGGTGDVLSGMAASWLARGTPPQIAGAAAAHVHGRSAEDVARHRSVRALRPDDLLGVLSPLWRELADGNRDIHPPLMAELERVAVT